MFDEMGRMHFMAVRQKRIIRDDKIKNDWIARFFFIIVRCSDDCRRFFLFVSFERSGVGIGIKRRLTIARFAGRARASLETHSKRILLRTLSKNSIINRVSKVAQVCRVNKWRGYLRRPSKETYCFYSRRERCKKFRSGDFQMRQHPLLEQRHVNKQSIFM